MFASGANPGEVTLFPDILRGWGITLEKTEGKPPLEWMNGVMQRFDQGIQYTLQRGMPEWHNKTDYPVHAVVQYGGLFYVSVKNNIGTTPGTDTEKWGLFWDGVPRLKMYKTLPVKNEGDLYLIGSGAHTETTLSPAQVDELVGLYTNLNSEVQVQKGRIAKAFGVDQHPYDMKSQRLASTIYTNSTGKCIYVHVALNGTGGYGWGTFWVGQEKFYSFALVNNSAQGWFLPVPDGYSYAVDGAGTFYIMDWIEYR